MTNEKEIIETSGDIPPFWGFSAFTPTIPKLYWNVKSQEQRILNLFDLLDKLICYVETVAGSSNDFTEQLQELKKELQDLKDGGLADLYKEQCEQWVKDNLEHIYRYTVKQVYFGLTNTGYFCAYIPESWEDVAFDTGAVFGTEQYGRLILRYKADGTGVIDNTAADYGYAATVNGMRQDIDKLNTTVYTDMDKEV